MKIRNVRIEAFRLFREEHVNLNSKTNREKASNFVALYAPNGFGKTSFFDALEFCMTRKIQRVSHDNFAENIKVDQKQNARTFIHNNDLPDKNVSIEIEFEGRDTEYFSCKPEEEIAILKGETHNVFFQNAILSQDWFSEFLATKSSTDRFKIFMNYFAETKDLLDYHELVHSNISSIGRKIGKLSREIKAKKAAINKKIGDEIFIRINEAVQTLKKWEQKISWQGVITGKTLVSLQIEAENILNQVEIQVKQCETLAEYYNKIVLGQSRLINIEELKFYDAEINKKKTEAEAIKEFMTKIANLKDLLFQKSKISETVCLKEKSVQRLSYLISNYVEYIKLQDKLAACHIKKKQLLAERNTQIALLEDKNKLLDPLNEKIVGLNSQVELTKKTVENLQEKFASYAALVKEQKALIDAKAETDTELIKQQTVLDEMLSISKKLNQIKNGILKKNPLLVENLYMVEIQATLELQSRIQQMNTELNKLKTSIHEKSNFNDDLQKFVTNSRNIISELKGGVCPLCGHDFLEYEVLLMNISENTIVATAIEVDIRRKEALTKTIDNNESLLTEAFDKLLKKVDARSNDLALQINETKTKLNKTIDKKSIMHARANEISVIINQNYFDIEGKTEIDVQNTHNNLLVQLNSSLKEIEEKKQVLNAKKILINETILKQNNQIELLQGEIVKIESTPFYIEFREISGLEIINENEKDAWLEQIEEDKNAILEEKEKLINLTSQIEVLKAEKIDLNQEDAVKQKYINAQNEWLDTKNRLSDTLNFLITNCQMKIDTINVDLKQIYDIFHDVIIKNKNEQKKLEDCKKALIDYFTLLQLGVKYNENEKCKKEYENLQYVKLKAEQQKELLSIEKERLETYLDGYVKGYFQLDLINRLYNIIDPHPEYKEIRFECNFSTKEPKLNILMNSVKDGKDSIVPNLYFSTAQINILSFCIFLAKALYAKTETGEDINCIFIDDPIQALDDINILSMIDLLRNVSFSLDKQIVITTHDRNFFELLKKKVPDNLFDSKFIQLKERGVFESA